MDQVLGKMCFLDLFLSFFFKVLYTVLNVLFFFPSTVLVVSLRIQVPDFIAC